MHYIDVSLFIQGEKGNSGPPGQRGPKGNEGNQGNQGLHGGKGPPGKQVITFFPPIFQFPNVLLSPAMVPLMFSQTT